MRNEWEDVRLRQENQRGGSCNSLALLEHAQGGWRQRDSSESQTGYRSQRT